jgi:hypothetical protein
VSETLAQEFSIKLAAESRSLGEGVSVRWRPSNRPSGKALAAVYGEPFQGIRRHPGGIPGSFDKGAEPKNALLPFFVPCFPPFRLELSKFRQFGSV